MANIFVEKAGLEAGIGVCKTCIHELRGATKSLKNSYTEAGRNWKDENYAKLGGILDDCMEALEKPIPDINNIMTALNYMVGIINASEEIF